MIKVKDLSFESYLSAAQIDAEIERVASKINEDHKDTTPLFIGVLNGSFMFVSDLMKKINLDCEISFVKMQSYEGTESTGEIKTSIGLNVNIEGRDVIVLEDIVDTGKTLYVFIEELKALNPKSIKLASLLHKKEATVYDVQIDYLCFEISNKFVLGYGLDYDGLGRNIPEIYSLVD